MFETCSRPIYLGQSRHYLLILKKKAYSSYWHPVGAIEVMNNFNAWYLNMYMYYINDDPLLQVDRTGQQRI